MKSELELADEYWDMLILEPKNKKEIEHNKRLCEEFEIKLKGIKNEKRKGSISKII